VLEAVQNVDMVLHVGGMVSPQADKYPDLTMRINVSAAQNIVNAIQAQPHPDRVKLVYIGSVAQTGHRDIPDHIGCAADRMNPAQFDHYAISKIIAERIIVESRLKYWVSLRQTSILYPELVMKGLNSIIFHVPLKGVLEWATVEDSGRLLVKLCEDKMPEDFWRRFYNISSGKSYRMTNYEFESKLLEVTHCPPPEKIFEPKWFATKNFHGYWYSDADALEEYLGFRQNMPCDDYYQQIIKKNIPWYFKLVKIVPPAVIKLVLRRIAHTKEIGTMHWIKTQNDQKIKAHFGCYEDWKKIPSWDNFDKRSPDKYSEKKGENNPFLSKPIQEWDLEDMRKHACSLNGKCLSESMRTNHIDDLLLWENEEGDRFHATPRYVIFGGFFPDHRLWSDLAKNHSN
jgi:nucleoside-diphosphate-sugar epimerase